MRKRSILPALCLILISCGSKNAIPPEVLQPGKMQLVLWDIMRADAATTQHLQTYTSPEAAAENVKLQKQVFAIHNITREDFYISLDYYKAHTNLMKVMMDSMVNKATREKVNILQIKSVLPTDPDLVK